MSQMRRHAEFSDDRVYRYRLSRVWGEGRRATFIMLNPSTADEYVDDRTLARCLAFARDWKLDGGQHDGSSADKAQLGAKGCSIFLQPASPFVVQEFSL